MSRSGYNEDCDNLDLYRSAVARALYGKRGQAFLAEMAASLDAMPVKELIADELVAADGACCAIGAVCKTRAMNVENIDPHDPELVARAVGIAWSMAAEIEYVNDECGPSREAPAARWQRLRAWVDQNLRQPPAANEEPALPHAKVAKVAKENAA